MTKLAQRERKGPARSVVTSADTLYDKLLSIALSLGDPSEESESLQEFTKEKAEAKDILNRINSLVDELSVLIKSDDLDPESIKGVMVMLEDDLIKFTSDFDFLWPEDQDFEEQQNQLEKLAEEVKEVALATHGGTTSPIDLGDWLY